MKFFKNLWVFFAYFLLVNLLNLSVTQADRLISDQVLLEPVDIKQKISEFIVKPNPFAVYEQDKARKKPYFIFEAVYLKKNAQLLVQGKPVEVDAGGKVHLKIPLSSIVSQMNFISVDIHGKIEKQSFLVKFPGWKVYQIRILGIFSKRSAYSLEFLASYITYEQTKVNKLSELGVVVKPSWSYYLNKKILDRRWDVGLNGYFIAWPLPLQKDNNRIRFLGINGRVGYLTRWLPEPWTLKFIGGWYYTTTFFQKGGFGFKDISGPMFFPTLSRKLEGQKSWFTYIKISPVSNALGFQLHSYELAAGGGFFLPASEGNLLLLAINVSHLSLNFANEASMKTQSISAGVGINW